MRHLTSTGPWWQKGLTIAVMAVAVAVWMACSDDDVEGCETHDDCPDGQWCEVDVCVEPEGEVECDVHDDCPSGMLCEDGETCVDDEGEVACESDADCGDGRFCDDEVCEIDPFGPFAPPTPVEDENYSVTYYGSSSQAEGQLRFVGVGEESGVEIDTGSVDCDSAHRCAVSQDGTHLLVVDSTGGGEFDILAAPLDGEPPAVSGDATTIANGVEGPRFRGDGVTYRRIENGNQYVAYFQRYDDSPEQLVTLHSEGESLLPHAFDYDPNTERVMHYEPASLDSLHIRVGGPDRSVEESLAFLDGSNRRGDAGSLYIGSVPTGVSPDGRFVAFVTTGPNNYENCGTDDDCTGTSHVCGTKENRCVAVEPTVNVIDMHYAELIGGPCTSHEDCGPVNRCDSGSETFDQGTCEPQRIVVGLPKLSQGSPSKTGCEATRDDGSFSFTDIEAPLTFGPDNRVYFVGQRDCIRTPADPDDDSEADIPRTSIVAGDLATGEYEEIWGNIDGDDFNIGDCGGGTGPAQDTCTIYIENARLTPRGNDIIFTGSNPTVGSQGLATSRLEVWRVDRDGDGAIAIGSTEGSLAAQDVAVHAGEEEPVVINQEQQNQSEPENNQASGNEEQNQGEGE